MKVSYNWLREYAPVEASAEELGEMLTMGGLEVEDVERVGTDLEGVVVGRVVEVRPHPNADRLTLCDVEIGNGDPVQIACGAPNVEAGQKVPVATIGTTLMLPSRDRPGTREPVTIRKAKIRGETSEGMICAEDELGLSDDHSGIMVLPEDAPVGRPFADYIRTLGLEPSDAVLDVSITPNRPDAACHIGVARDAAALTGTPFAVPEIELPQEGGETAAQVTVDIQAPDGCPRYVALLLRDVHVSESPAWLKRRLTAIGLRPRNNVVDATNYVMFESGQPLHAFDFDEIEGSTIRVRRTDEETAFTTLDGKQRMLPTGTLMICDADRDVAIAGVMGGENSEVSEKTTRVLIESAYFDPSTVRRTARALGLQTDASYRFERGVDRDGQVWAAARAAALIAELSGGSIVQGMVDAHPVPFQRRLVALRSWRVDELLGVHIPTGTTKQLLESIGIETAVREGVDPALHDDAEPRRSPRGPVLACTVPSYRPDVEREVDLIEEVVRLFGYDRVPEPETSVAPTVNPGELLEDRFRGSIRSYLSSIGYREAYTNSMLRSETAESFNQTVLTGERTAGAIVETLNPISQQMTALRPSLLPGALQVMSFNRKHGGQLLRFFELGHVFHRSETAQFLVDGYAEHESVILMASGPATESGWDTSERLLDLFDVKGTVTALLESVHVPDVRMEPVYRVTKVTRHHLDVYSGSVRLGIVARLADGVAEKYDLKEPVYFSELDFEAIVKLAAPQRRRAYRPVSRYPVVERDIAVVVDRGQKAGALLQSIRDAGGDLLIGVRLFDLYAGPHAGEGKKSAAFSLRFGADRTLTDREVDERVAAVVDALVRGYGATLRVT